MKRKFFSTLLMGALLIASMSMVTSCKDYDDDINRLEASISALQNQIAAIQTAHQTCMANCARAQETADAARKEAAAAQATADQALIEARAAQARGDQALAEALNAQAQAAQAEADALQAKADAAAAMAAAQAARADALSLIEQKANELWDAVNGKVDIDTFNKAVSDLYAAIDVTNARFEEVFDLLNKKADKAELEDAVRALQQADRDNAQEIADIQKRIAEVIVPQLADILSRLAGIDQDIINLKVEDGKLWQELGQHAEAIYANKVAIENLGLQMTALQNLIDYYNSESIERDRVLAEALGVLENELALTKKRLEARIDSLAAITADHEDRISTNERNIAQLQREMKATNARIDSLNIVVTAQGVAIKSLQDTVKILDNKIELNKAEIQKLNQRLTIVKENVNLLYSYIAKNLTSLVHKPNRWVLSYPAIEAAFIEKHNVYGFQPAKDLVNEGEIAANANETASFCPELVANYWLNPSTTDWEAYEYSYVDLETTNETRGHQDDKSCKPTVTTVSADDGVLTVKFTVDPENVNDAITHFNFTDVDYGQQSFNMKGTAWLSTVALQATRKAGNIEIKDSEDYAGDPIDETVRTITSDYALIVPTLYRNLKLGNNKWATESEHLQGNQEYHLNTICANTIAEDRQGIYSFDNVDYEWDGTLDLNKYIDVHYDFASGFGETEKFDQVMTNKAAQELGFEFKYTLVPYKKTADAAKTEDQYFKIEGSELSLANPGDREAASHVAIVRCELVANGKTFAFGYVSLLVTNKTVDVTVDLGDIDLLCPEEGAEYPYDRGIFLSVKYADIVKKLAEALQITEAEFAEAYKLDVIAQSGQYEQWWYVREYNRTTGKVAQWLGQALTDYVDFGWRFSVADMQEFWSKNTGAPIYDEAQFPNNYAVKFLAQNEVYEDILLKVNFGTVHYPKGSFSKDQRIQEYWYKAYTNDKAQAEVQNRDDIHANVEVYGQPGADDEFVFDIAATFYGNKFTITPINDKMNFSTEGVVKFDKTKYPETVNGSSGKTYTLNVTQEGTALVVGNDTIVKLIGEYNGYAEFQHNAVAEDILNYYTHSGVGKGQSFRTHMILDADGTYCMPIVLSGDRVFDIVYLRPIDVIEDAETNVIDAVDGGNYIYLADLVKFKDWRDYVITKDNDGMKYINYYGITEILPDVAAATTNLDGVNADGSWKKLSDITDRITLQAVDADGNPLIGKYEKNSSTQFADFRNALGYLYYGNVSATVKDFSIKLPIDVVYDWGKIYSTTVTINVKYTEGNAKGF